MSQNLSILLLGKTGNGKSSTGNTLLNDNTAFESQASQDSVTKECDRKECFYGGYNLSVVDTPGVFDTSTPIEEAFEKISTAMILSPEGYHVIAIVVKYGSRFTKEEAHAINHLERLFGKDLFRFAIIVVTFADLYKKDRNINPHSFPEECEYMMNTRNADFNKLFQKCGGRYAFCENYASNVEGERQRVLAEVQELVSQNGGERYTNDLFIIAKKALQRSDAARKKAEDERQKEAARSSRYKEELAQKESDRKTLLHCLESMSGDELARMFKNLSYTERQRVIKQVSPAVKEKAEKAGACFPKDATCILVTGDVLKMEHLQHGDKVQVVLPDGTLDYQEIFMFGHADPNTEGAFLMFTTENQRQLSISPGHYLYVKGQDGKMEMIPARNVQIGDALYTFNPENDTMEFSVVNEFGMETLRGLYNPHTKSGTIVVNGITASCYTEAFSPVWAHRLLQPVWFLYKMVPWINRVVAKDGMPVWLSILDIGKSALEKMGLPAWQ